MIQRQRRGGDDDRIASALQGLEREWIEVLQVSVR
jgi:hypothetical protein